MRECILHLGTPKTGTTTIQRALMGFDTGTHAAMGFGRLSIDAHLVNLFCAPAVRARSSTNVMRGHSAADVDRMLPEMQAEFDAQLTGRGSEVLVISCEAMASDLFDAGAIDRLITALEPHFDRIRAVAYLREPVSFMISHFQQGCKTGMGHLSLERWFPCYRARLEGWIDRLEMGQVALVRFDRASLVGGDVLEDFAQHIGADLPRVAADENIAHSAQATALLHTFRELRGLTRENAFLRKKNYRATRLLAGFGTAPLGLRADLARRHLESWAEDIAWAETQMGQAFGPYRPKPGAVLVNSDAELAQVARDCLPEFEAWVAQAAPPGEFPVQRVAEAVDLLFSRVR